MVKGSFYLSKSEIENNKHKKAVKTKQSKLSYLQVKIIMTPYQVETTMCEIS